MKVEIRVRSNTGYIVEDYNNPSVLLLCSSLVVATNTAFYIGLLYQMAIKHVHVPCQQWSPSDNDIRNTIRSVDGSFSLRHHPPCSYSAD